MKRDELRIVLRPSAAFVRTLLANGSVSLNMFLERISMLDPAKHNLQHITQWTQRRAQEATE